MVEFNKITLSNGLTILHEKRDVDVTTVMFAVPYGAMYESINEKGISHLIEHLCFKGTPTRTTKQISDSLESVGGELNAFTHEETTAYYVRLPSNYLELAVDVLGDVFFNANFPEDEFEKEKNVVMEEINMYNDNPSSHTMEMLKTNLYEEPFGMFIGGNVEDVERLTREQVVKKHNDYYVPKNSFLCVVGNNSFEDVVSFAQKYVGFQKDGLKIDKLDVKKKINSSIEKREGVIQSNLALGVHVPYKGKGRIAIEVFNAIFGDGMSSKLFEEVREKLGLVYVIKSDLDIGRNYGYLLIFAGTDESNVSKVIEISKKVFYDMKNISFNELEKAKIKVIGNRKVHSESSNDTALNLIFSEMYSSAEDYYNYEKEVSEITLDDIKSLVDNVEFSTFILKNKR